MLTKTILFFLLNDSQVRSCDHQINTELNNSPKVAKTACEEEMMRSGGGIARAKSVGKMSQSNKKMNGRDIAVIVTY